MFKRFVVLIVVLCIFQIRVKAMEGVSDGAPDGAAYSMTTADGTTRAKRRLVAQFKIASALIGSEDPAHITQHQNIKSKFQDVKDLSDQAAVDRVVAVWDSDANMRKHAVKAEIDTPAPWTTTGIVMGSAENTVTSGSDIRGIEFIADHVTSKFKVIGFLRVLC